MLAPANQKGQLFGKGRESILSDNELRELVHQEVEQLPPERLQEVLAFVRWLRYREALPSEMRTSAGKPDSEDPLSELIGMVAHGQLAHDIDRELYGP